jgi:outer membrane receptor protein involved in Fe transport
MTKRLTIPGFTFLLLPATIALAQTAPAPKPAPVASADVRAVADQKAPAPVDPSAPVQQIEIVAEHQTNRIDRQVYDVKSDISTVNSSTADVLSNVPSVQVDPDGAVRLRGNTNVTILLDGKPSAMLTGDNRGAALNAMPADFIESIEVVNNPGAEFGNEGGGGPILNLISRRNRRPGGFGSITGNAGTAGRYNTGINGSYSAGYASIDSFLNFRHDGRGSTTGTVRESLDPLTGLFSPSKQDGKSAGLNSNLNFNTAFRYNVGKADRTGGSIGYLNGDRDSNSLTEYRNFAPDGTLIGDSLCNSVSKGHSRNVSGSGFYEHKFDTDDATLKVDLRVSSSQNTSAANAVRTYQLSFFPRPDEKSAQTRFPKTRIADLTADYTGKLGTGFMAAGFKLIDTRQDFDTRYAVTDPLTGVETINTNLTNAFTVDERVLAGYGTYEYRFDEQWSVKGGARVEHTELDIQQITANITAGNNYTNVMPSAYVQYKLDKDSFVRFAYSHRLHRPNSNDLNPYMVYQSPTDRSVGNPNLRPAQSNSFELSYDTTWIGVKTDLRLFVRDEDDVITQRQVLIKDEQGQDVVLTTRQNFGTSKSQGLEFVFNGRPITGLTLNLSGNLRHAEQTQFAGLGLPSTLSGTSLSGRMRVNYQLTAEDQVQLALQGNGKQLWGQGYREPNWTANLTWQHKISPLLTLTLNTTDLFNSNRMEAHTTSDILRQTTLTRYDGRVIYFGFRYQLGGVTGNPQQREGGRPPEGRGGPGGMMPGGGPGGGGPGGGPM